MLCVSRVEACNTVVFQGGRQGHVENFLASRHRIKQVQERLKLAPALVDDRYTSVDKIANDPCGFGQGKRLFDALPRNGIDKLGSLLSKTDFQVSGPCKDSMAGPLLVNPSVA